MIRNTRLMLTVLSGVILATALAAGCSGGNDGAASSNNQNNNTNNGNGAAGANINLVSLGDSIARGLGSTSGQGFANIFRDYLSTQTTGTVVLTNRGVNGYTTGNLISQLQADTSTQNALQNANVITVSISGNDLLPCANASTGSINSVCASNGVATIQSDWPKILQLIRGLNTTAKIYVLSLYNLYPANNPNAAQADAIVRQVNAILQDPATIQTYHYKVADVYSAFQNNVCTDTHICDRLPDVHPNDAGYSAIALAIQAIYP